MNFEFSDKSKALQDKVKSFMDQHLYPIEKEAQDFFTDHNNLWQEWPGIEDLKQKAREAGLWNLFLPKNYGDYSPGLSNLEYAPLAQEMGKIPWCSEVFNCSAPDTGNMEVFAKYGTQELKDRWLTPLMEGKIRSAFLMTEPRVASSDATNIETSIRKEGDSYVINGRKWWSSGVMHPRTDVYILMGKTDPSAPRHVQQSMIVVPADTPGITILRLSLIHI